MQLIILFQNITRYMCHIFNLWITKGANNFGVAILDVLIVSFIHAMDV